MEQKTEASQAVDEPVLPHLPRAVGYLHTMDNTEGLKGNQPWRIFNFIKRNPFGKAGLDYSASYPVTNESLFTASQMKEYARAVLKAQPAPTEAQGKATDEMCRAAREKFGISANMAEHIWNHMLANAPTEAAQGESPFKFRPWSKESEMMESWTAAERAREAAQGAQLSGNSGELARGEDSARLDAERYRYFRRIYGAEARLIRGPIFIAETPEQFDAGIDECIRYEQEVARASTETGGVKP